jgi:hypothetical protein
MTYQEHVQKTTSFIETNLTKHRFSDAEVKFCKSIHDERVHNKQKADSVHPTDFVINGRISRQHTDEDLYFGLLSELMVARELGKSISNRNILRDWAEDQIRQNKMVLSEGKFDSKDVGNCQIRAAQYSSFKKRNIIYRDNDFRTKATQPLIGCIINTQESDIWAVMCGFMSYADLIRRRHEFWSNPDGRLPAMFIPIWELSPMENFDLTYLL